MKKKIIIDFLKNNSIKNFNELSEPSAIAYETFSKTNNGISFKYFNRIFNEINIILIY